MGKRSLSSAGGPHAKPWSSSVACGRYIHITMYIHIHIHMIEQINYIHVHVYIQPVSHHPRLALSRLSGRGLLRAHSPRTPPAPLPNPSSGSSGTCARPGAALGLFGVGQSAPMRQCHLNAALVPPAKTRSQLRGAVPFVLVGGSWAGLTWHRRVGVLSLP
jgi:hypothetical protein